MVFSIISELYALEQLTKDEYDTDDLRGAVPVLTACR
jgi:hypothetical protein